MVGGAATSSGLALGAGGVGGMNGSGCGFAVGCSPAGLAPGLSAIFMLGAAGSTPRIGAGGKNVGCGRATGRKRGASGAAMLICEIAGVGVLVNVRRGNAGTVVSV